MTRRPPPRIPGAAGGPPLPDPARDGYLTAWLAAYTRHQRAVRAERRRFAAECAALREQYRAASPRPVPPHPRNRVAWTQGTLDEAGVITTGNSETGD